MDRSSQTSAIGGEDGSRMLFVTNLQALDNGSKLRNSTFASAYRVKDGYLP